MKTMMMTLLLLAAGSAHAIPMTKGTGDSGGGMGVVCRDRDSKVQSVELLDLWEARSVYFRKISTSTESVESLIQDAAKNLSLSFPPSAKFRYGELNGYESIAQNILDSVRGFDHSREDLHGVKLPLSPDANLEANPPSGCEVEQLVIYKSNGPYWRALVNQDLYEKMDDLNKAALQMHEGLYEMMRRYDHEKNSDRARRLVGLAFSNYKFKSLDSMLPKQYFECTNGMGTKIYFFSRENPGQGDSRSPYRLEIQVESVQFNSQNWLRGYGFSETSGAYTPLRQSEVSLADIKSNTQETVSLGGRLVSDYLVVIETSVYKRSYNEMKVVLYRASGLDVNKAKSVIVTCREIRTP